MKNCLSAEQILSLWQREAQRQENDEDAQREGQQTNTAGALCEGNLADLFSGQLTDGPRDRAPQRFGLWTNFCSIEILLVAKQSVLASYLTCLSMSHEPASN